MAYKTFTDKLTKEERAILKEARAEMSRRGVRIRRNHCFDNATHLALTQAGQRAGIKYVEGLLYVKGQVLLRVHHGWNVLNGKIIDLTPLPGMYERFGVEIPTTDLIICSCEARRRSELPGHLTPSEYRRMEERYHEEMGITVEHFGGDAVMAPQ